MRIILADFSRHGGDSIANMPVGGTPEGGVWLRPTMLYLRDFSLLLPCIADGAAE